MNTRLRNLLIVMLVVVVVLHFVGLPLVWGGSIGGLLLIVLLLVLFGVI